MLYYKVKLSEGYKKKHSSCMLYNTLTGILMEFQVDGLKPINLNIIGPSMGWGLGAA